MPSVVAPGLSLPIARTQAEMDCRNRESLPLTEPSQLSGVLR
jgi:hypothetical protein